LLYQRTVLLLTLLFLVGVVSVLWHLTRLSSNLVESATLQSAARYSEALAEFRTLYTSEVVARVQNYGIEVAHDYANREGAIPLPATLSLILGEQIGQKGSGILVRLYSPYPFPWRQQTGGLQDGFAAAAWSSLQQQPGQVFYRFEDFQGRRTLRYATADLMRTECVHCHNTHPDTPKKDWQTGDMRGVLEVLLPVDQLGAETRAQLHGTFALIAGMSLLGLSGLVLVIGRFRRISEDLEQQVQARTSDLEAINEQLQEESAEREQAESEQAVLVAMREQVWAMERSIDIENVLRAVHAGLEQLAIPFDHCGINIVVEPDEPSFVSYNIDVSGEELELGRKTLGIELLAKVWRQGQASYRRDVHREDAYDECAYMNQSYRQPVCSVLDVPFSHGTLALNSGEPDAFSAKDIRSLERIAEVLSEAFRRWDDLKIRQQHLAALTHEIAERKETERRLEESRLDLSFHNALLTSQQEATLDGILVVDGQGRWISYNQRFLDMWNIPPQLLTRGTSSDCLPDSAEQTVDLEGFVDRMRYLFDRPDEDGYDEIAMKDGRTLERYSTALRSLEGQYYDRVGYYRDITQHKQMEKAQIRTQRLRAVGELAAGVSHNLNNILTGVLAPAQLIQLKTGDPDLLREVGDIIASARRARDLVHRLHLSVRGVEEDSLQSVPVNQVVQEAVQAARPRWKDEAESRGLAIEVVTRLQDVPPIQGTASRLHDLLTNLLFNAVDALPEGGTITLETQPAEGEVQLTCRDTGIGMDEATSMHVFETFFTTKMDVGSGLGLSTGYNTVQQWGGQIEVESAPGAGTTFTVRLPVWTEPLVEAETQEGGAPGRGAPGQKGRLLVVEDDKGVQDVLDRFLSVDHEMEIVSNGEEALARFAPGRYDAVLVDLGLPGLAGDQVVQEMQRLDPLVSTVLITGWELESADPRLSVFDFHLQKPFGGLNEVEQVVARAVALHDTRCE
jgi:signal transduction histidine kinase